MKVKNIYNNNKVERHFKWLSLKEKVMVMIERIILKLKNTYKFLKIERIISNIYFKKTFFVICGLILCNIVGEKLYYALCQYSIFDNIRTIIIFNQNNYFQFLIASLGIGGFLTALFFSNLSGIQSSKYSNLDSELSSAILNEYMNKTYFDSIVNYLIIIVIQILMYVLEIVPGIFVSILTFVLTVRIVIIFITLSKRLFQFANINFITYDIFQEIAYYFDKLKLAAKHSKSDSIMKSYYNIINSKLSLLKTLFNSLIEQNDSKGLVDFNKHVLVILSKYTKDKNLIPFNSPWYEDKPKDKSWFTADFFEINLGLNTGTSLNQSYEKDINFFENNLMKLFFDSFEYCIKNNKKEEAYSLLNFYHSLYNDLVFNGDYSYWYDQNIKIMQVFLDNIECFNDDGDYSIGLFDLLGLIFVDYILGNTKYIETTAKTVEKYTKDYQMYKKSIESNNIIFNCKRSNDLLERLELEHNIEGKIITTNKYIQEYTNWQFNRHISNYLKKLIEIIPKLQQFANSFKDNNKIGTCLVLSRIVEISNKIINNLQHLEPLINTIENTNVNFKIDKIDIEQFLIETNKLYVNSMAFYSDIVCSLVSEEDNYKKCKVDFLGEVYYNITQEVFNSIIDEDFDNFQKLYKKFAITCFVSDLMISKIVNSESNAQYKAAKYTMAMINYMRISGYAIYYAHLVKDFKWENLVKETFDSILETIKDKEIFLERMSNIVDYKSTSFFPEIDKTDFERLFSKFVENSNYIKYKYIEPFLGKVVDSDDELITNFSFYHNSYHYDFYEIFVEYCINPKLDKSKKINVRFIKEQRRKK